MESKPVAIVLGGTVSHVDLIDNLKKKNYYVVLFDYLDNPPAREHADLHLKVSTLDRDLVYTKAKELKASLVITLCLDQPIPVACYVSERLNLPIPYSYETSVAITDKTEMKKVMVEHGIPTSEYFIASSLADCKNKELEFPLVMKPADGTGTLGVKKVLNLDQMSQHFESALTYSRSKKVIIEKFNPGVEWNLYYFVQDKKPIKMLALQKIKPQDYDNDFADYDPFIQLGTLTNHNLPEDFQKKTDDLSAAVVEAFKLKNTFLLLQVVVNENDIKIIEIAARLGGTGASNELIKNCYKFDIIDFLIDNYLGSKNQIVLSHPDSNYAICFIYASKGIFKEITGLKELMRDEIIVWGGVVKNTGMIINEDLSSKSRIATVLLRGKEKKDLLEKIQIVMNSIDVLDVNNHSILIRDLFIK